MGGTTTKYALRYPVASDPNNVPADMLALAQDVDAVMSAWADGTLAARPAFGKKGRLYSATDNGAIYFDTGTAWTKLNLDTAALVTTKGDLVVGSAVGVLARQPAGTDGYALVARAGATLGVAYELQLGQPLALTGATAATRFGGGISTGSPTSGTWAVGDFVIAQDGKVWICTAAGTPGTWIAASLGLPLGLTGATAATRYAGATASGAPSSGTFAVGDFSIARNGQMFICTAAGTPGTWIGANIGLPAGLTGATAATRYAGGTTSAAPSSGTFSVGDFVVSQDGGIYLCTIAGTPGTWVRHAQILTYQAIGTSNLDLAGTAAVAVPGATVTFTAVGQCNIVVNAKYDVANNTDGGSVLFCYIYLDGAPVDAAFHLAAAPSRGTPAGVYNGAVAAGSHTVDLRAARLVNAGAQQIGGVNTKLVTAVIPI